MLRATVIAIFLCFVYDSNAQTKAFPSNLDQVKKESQNHFRWRFKDPAELAQELTQDYTTEEEKAFALANFIVCNVRYDYRRFRNFSWSYQSNAKILRRGKAVCGGYSNLYKELCEAVGLECEVINGYTKGRFYVNGDSLCWVNHAWNAVKISGEWYLLDLTWSSGYVKPRLQLIRRFMWRYFRIPFQQKYKFKRNTSYGFIYTEPEQFIKSHFPVISDFQLLKPEVPIDSFYNEALIPEFTEKDSLFKLDLNLKNDQKMERFASRGELSKLLYQAEKAPFTNPENQNISGYFYYKAFFEKLNYYYDYETNITSSNIKALRDLDSMAVIADSMIFLGHAELRDNYKKLNDRNLDWKLRNNEVCTSIRRKYFGLQRSYAYCIRKKMGSRAKCKRNEFLLNNTISQIKRTKGINTKRPLREKDDAPDSVTFLKGLAVHLNTIDSIKSILDSLRSPDYIRITQNEFDLIDEHFYRIELNKEYLKYYFFQALYRSPNVHQNDEFIEKADLIVEMDTLVNSQEMLLKKSVERTDSFLMNYYLAMLEYRIEVNNAIRYCQSIKRRSIIDLGEDEAIDSIASENLNYVESTKPLFDTLENAQRRLSARFKRLNRKMRAPIKMITQDKGRESRRYGYYKSYLNLEKGHRIRNLRALQNHLRDYHNAVKRGISQYEKGLAH
jgi:hypothetical protein